MAKCASVVFSSLQLNKAGFLFKLLELCAFTVLCCNHCKKTSDLKAQMAIFLMNGTLKNSSVMTPVHPKQKSIFSAKQTVFSLTDD